MGDTPRTAPSFTHGGIDFWIVDTTKPEIRSEYSQEAASLDLTLRCNWDLRKDARAALLGGTEYMKPPGSQFGYLSRTLPHRYEDEEDWLWCKRVPVEPEISREDAGPGTGPGALYAIFRAHYEARPYELLDDADVIVAGFPDESSLKRFISRPPHRSKDRTLLTKGGGWKWVDNNRTIPTAIPITINESEFTLVWHQIPIANIPWTAITDLWACTNSLTFNNYTAGKLVFIDVAFKECPRLTDGTLAVDIHYTFAKKPKGANFFPDPDRSYRFFEVVAADGSGNKPHTAGDYRSLFRPVDPP